MALSTTWVTCPAFAGGVPLGDYLQESFGIPVFINNDGDLFVYGEAIGGFLPKVNKMLEDAGSPKRFNKLFWDYFGHRLRGRALWQMVSCMWVTTRLRAKSGSRENKRHPKCFAEEGVSIRAVQGSYAKAAGIDPKDAPTPKDIYEIGTGQKSRQQRSSIAGLC